MCSGAGSVFKFNVKSYICIAPSFFKQMGSRGIVLSNRILSADNDISLNQLIVACKSLLDQGLCVKVLRTSFSV